MAENREKISLSFGIQDVQESAELLADLTGPEVTAEPAKVTNLQDDPDQPPATPAPKLKKAPEKPKLKEGEEAVEDGDEETDYQKIMQDYLSKKDEPAEDTQEGDEGEDKTDSPDDSIWTALGRDLVKRGIFTQDEDEEGNATDLLIKSPEEFESRFIDEINQKAEDTLVNFLGKYGDEYKQAFDAIFVKGVSPKEYYSTKHSIDNIKDLDLKKESNQELIIRRALQEQELDDEEIDKEITRLKNYGDLEPVAERYHKVQVKKEEKRLSDLSAKQEQERETRRKIEEHFEESVFEILNDKYKNKEFDGIPVNKVFAEKTMDMLTAKKYKLPSGELLTEFDKQILELKRPENYTAKVKLAMLMQLIKTDPNFSTLKRKAVSEQSNDVFNEVARHKFKSTQNKIKDKRTFND